MKKRFLGGAAARRASRNTNMRERELAVTPLLLSGKDEAGLCAQAQRLREYLLAHPQLEILDVALSLAKRSPQLEERGAVLGGDRESLLAGLAALASGESGEGSELVRGVARAGGAVFVFPGQGGQWPGMGAELLDRVPVCAEALRACGDALSEFVDWSLEDVLRGVEGAPSLERSDVVQPATFAVMVALAAWWRSLGVHPVAVVGQSMGEIVAAHVAGGLSLRDAMRVMALRSLAMAEEMAGTGGMAVVSGSIAEVEQMLTRWDGRLSVAAITGPRTAVVSGEVDALEELLEACDLQGGWARRIAVDYAAHSPAMDGMRERLLEDLAPIEPHTGNVKFCSTLTGAPLDTKLLNAEYWFRNERERALVERAIRELVLGGVSTFIEVSPHPTLTLGVQATVDDIAGAEAAVLSSLRRGGRGPERLVSSLAEAHANGVEVDWEAFFAGTGAKRVDLPDAIFQQDARSKPSSGALRGRLADVAESEWEAILLGLVREEVAKIVGASSADAVEPHRAFKELGLDSASALELQARLSRATGLRLPASLAFDRPSVAAVVDFLCAAAKNDGPEVNGTSVTSTRDADPGEPVAIVGMSCRYPGARTPEELWQLVARGGDAIGTLPNDRGWDLGALYDPDPDRRGTSYVREGGFIENVGDFDAGFFGIGPREATAIDPQQRLLLEATWEALDDAGIDPLSLRGSQTGIFAGLSSQDYLALQDPGSEEAEGFRLTGSLGSVASGRVAYSFGFEGPAVTVDTACSSSLVALHLACQAVRSGECWLALAGGVTLMASPAMLIEFSRQRGLSRDGRCRSFAADAEGIGWSEGVGLLVLERLSVARRLGHRVLGVVRGSAINQDGASNGLTAPNGPSQERVIRRALVDAGLVPGEVDAVEAHGTGTTLGDPIEAQALLATYGQRRERGPLWLGSVKSNIGHPQAAAGVAGVIKMLKAFEHERLPQTLHVQAPTPHVDWSAGEVQLLTESREWPAGERPRRAGVSSFGISGTNAHVILEEAPRVEVSPPARRPVGRESLEGEAAEIGTWGCGVVPMVVSGRGVGGLCGQAGRLRERLAGDPLLEGDDALSALRDVAFSLTARAGLEDRGVVLGGDREALVRGLGALTDGGVSEGVVRGVVRAGKPVFVFPGQGAQWEGMAVGLLDSSPVFRDALGKCGEALEGLVDWRVEDVLRGVVGAPGLERVDVVQPVSFAVMVALAELWRSFGVQPGVVVGHSQGEIAAACAAGGLSLQDAARVVVLRSRLLGEVLAGRGGMVSVALDLGRVEELIGGWGGRLSVAAVNGPSAVVVSGESQALDELLVVCERDGVWARRVAVDYASHSAAVEELHDQLVEALAGIEPVSCGVSFFSTATGEFLDTALLDGEYWYKSLRERVRFEDATRALAPAANAFIEVSPHPVLTGAIGQTLEVVGLADRVGVLGSLRREEGGTERFLRSLAEAWVVGAPVDWSVCFADSGAQRVELPRYAFQRERYWLTPKRGVGDASGMGLGAASHPLLGAAVQLAGGDEWLFTGRLSLDTSPWLADHAVLDTVLLPATAFLELALATAGEVGCDTVEELTLQAPLVLAQGTAVQLQVALGEPNLDGRREIQIHSREQPEAAAGEQRDTDSAWTQHAIGTLLIGGGTEGLGLAAREPPAQWPPAQARAIDVELLYDRLAETGYEYGPVFQGLQAAWQTDDGEIYAEVTLDEQAASAAAEYILHPALLDAALHAGLPAQGDEPRASGTMLPFSLSGVSLYRSGVSALRVRLVRGEGEVQLMAFDDAGEPVLSIGSLVLRSVDPGGPLRASALGTGGSLHRLEWTELQLAEQPHEEAQHCALLADLQLAGVDGEHYTSLSELVAAIEDGSPVPDVVFVAIPTGAGDLNAAQAARRAVGATLELLQGWLAADVLARSRLVLLTTGAVAVLAGEVPDLAGASVWGLLRGAQAERPGSFAIFDCDPAVAPGAEWLSDAAEWAKLIAADESQLALRGGTAYVPRLAVLDAAQALSAPRDEVHWHFGSERLETFEDLTLLASPRASAPLAPGEVRVAVHAAGLNFHDVYTALGIGRERGETTIGLEGAGVVLEVGEDVVDLAPGDRVMGLMDDAFGPVTVTPREWVVPIPEGWSFVQAAAVPIVFATAYYGLRDLAALQEGESLLVHSAAGGVGMAAVQLARHLGAEVFATASPAKAQVLAGLGLDSEHTASSRDLEFEHRFLGATGGRGVDVVLNSLTREFVDASLALLPRDGGRFLEMGKTDIRDVQQLAHRHGGVRYHAFDLYEAGPQRIQEMLQELLVLFERGALTHHPITTWDVRDGMEAFRFMREARHVGKIVLTIPQPVDPQGTVLITGGTGGLGALVARHLASERGMRHLLLASRSGPEADGAGELVAELAELGCEAQAVACDVADRAQAEQLIASIPSERPLSSVIHAAGVLDDGLIETLTPERLERAMRPKVDAALNLHELTEGIELAEFVTFSSVMGLIGGAGQGNYAAANSFLDALAQVRLASGLAGQSLAWGLWAQASGMTGGLGETGRARMARQGLAPLSSSEGLALLDRAAAVGGAHLVAARLDMGSLRAQARVGVLPVVLGGLVRGAPSRRRSSHGNSLARRLAGVPEREWEELVLEVVRAQAAAVLGHASPAAIDPQRSLKDQGLDSLGAVELRTRLAGDTDLTLPATLVFDRPNCEAIAEFLRAQVEVADPAAARVPAARVGRGAALDEPIAIVGMSCRYPGRAHTAQELWELVAEGRDAISPLPSDRGWDLDAVYDPDPDHVGTSYTRMGGFIQGIGDFDADFFGISPREALAMDPQQRMLLEVAWEALEDAGIDPAALRGSQTGVFAGTTTLDYLGPQETGAGASETFRLTGSLSSVVSGRVAYSFGFEGPAVSVDTACSSSLVALHLACQAVRNGECSLALAGGVTLMASPALLIDFSRQRGLAVDGRCKSFAASADGAGFSDGAGLLVVERLSDAQRLGHRVLGVVRGSAINQDGASNGLTAPNGPSQERVIRRALQEAGLSPGEVDAVEAHGTGTTLGDPIEAQALLATYGQGREHGPLWLGSVKSNIGHAQAAAGVAGVIKMLKAFEHERLPQTLHVDEPTPHVDWSAGAVELLTQSCEWPAGERPRRAGVSSFGISGTNAHVVLEEPPPIVAESRAASGSSLVESCGVVPVLVSGRGASGLCGQAARLREHLAGDSRLDGEDAWGALVDVAFSLSARGGLEDRGVVLGGERDVLVGRLGALTDGGVGEGVVRGVARKGRVVFVFPGQGAQWEGMAVGLLDSSPVFRDALSECGEALEGLVDWRVEDVLRGVEGAPSLERVDVVQPVSFAVMVALAELWRSFGVQPGVVVGHSQGEIAAACVAG
ncbi:MAG TPA: SDR family NAD(P)-dependent oxidoreductase, partial [Solirubrobacteraceae bacterium]